MSMMAYSLDYQIGGGELRGYTVCAKCLTVPATVRLTVNRVEQAGRFALESFADYCDGCIDEARKQTRDRIHVKLYGRPATDKGAA